MFVLQKPLDALDHAQGRVLEVVAGIEFKLRGDAARSHQVGHGPGALAHGLQYGIARGALLVAHREIGSSQLACQFLFLSIFQPTGVPHRPRCRQDAREQIRLEGRPYGKQARQRVTRQAAPCGWCVEQTLDLWNHFAGKYGQPLASLACKVVILVR